MRGITDGAERQDYCQSCLGIPERVRQQGGSRVGSTVHARGYTRTAVRDETVWRNPC